MGMSLDPVHDEIAVASYGNDSVLIFHRTDRGDVVPVRIIRGNRTALAGPMGVSVDTKNDEIWVTNYREHTALVFARTAEGNVAPIRVLRNAPPRTPAVGFGNPGAVAYDSKRDQILVPN
jgi:DNA-binding beta-propeller fold protein YncE